MLDLIARKVKKRVQKGVIPKKMKIVIVLGNDQKDQYIVQSRYYKSLHIERPGQRIMLETEYEAAARLVALATTVTPTEQDVVIVDSKGSGTNLVSYVFWFAPPDFDLAACQQLQGNVLSLSEQLSLEHEWMYRKEARIAFDLFLKAAETHAARSGRAA